MIVSRAMLLTVHLVGHNGLIPVPGRDSSSLHCRKIKECLGDNVINLHISITISSALQTGSHFFAVS